MSKKIYLTKGKVVIVDDEDYEYLNQWKWFAQNNSYTFYACRQERVSKNKQKTIRMHRLIMKAESDQDVDHKDHDGLNNRKKNLRLCSRTQNMGNKIKYKNGITSLYRGVCWHKRDECWRVQISINKKVVVIGNFIDEDIAALAYNLRAIEVFGEFSLINEIENLDEVIVRYINYMKNKQNGKRKS